MSQTAINLAAKFAQINEHWSPRVIAELNNYQFKLAKLQGEFVWHQHDDTDEAFMVIEGELTIELDAAEAVQLRRGELYVVPKGVRHRPVAANECQVLLIEPKGVVNTGAEPGDLTAANDVWI